MLAEVLGVPSAIEGNLAVRDSRFSFYDKDSRFELPDTAYPVDALLKADSVNGDCSQTAEPCAHMLPSVWSGGKQDVKRYQSKYCCTYHDERPFRFLILFLVFRNFISQ